MMVLKYFKIIIFDYVMYLKLLLLDYIILIFIVI